MSASTRALRRLLRDRTGAAAMEFALLLPVVATSIVGLLQFAWALHCAASVRWALETSARSLLMNPSATAQDVKSAMAARLTNVADMSNVSIALSTQTANGGARVIHAASTYVYNLQIMFLPAWRLTFNAATDVPAP